MYILKKTHIYQPEGTETLRRLKNEVSYELLHPFLRFLTLFCFKLIKYDYSFKNVYYNENVNLTLVLFYPSHCP